MDTHATTPLKPVKSNETAIAIVASFVISAVVASVVFGNPFHVLRLAYLDYSHTPAGGAAKASTTEAPATAPEVANKTK